MCWKGRNVYRALLLTLMVVATLVAVLLRGTGVTARAEDVVYVIPVEGDIDLGLVSYLKRGLETATKKGARAVILDINTFGGRVDAAIQLKDLIIASPLPVVAYVHNRAWSAGALISLAADYIIMAPGSSIGAAEPRVGDQPADEKVISALREEFVATAEHTGRDALLAAAMVDADIAIPGVIADGKLLTLSAQQAVELGLADAVLGDYQEILDHLNYKEASLIFVTPTMAERVARFLTNPLISPFLLTLGFTGLVLELYTAGWGIPGTIGLVSLALYFGGHLVAGLAGWWVVGLFLLGIFLFLLELLVIPGFGIAGISGIMAVLASIFLASTSSTQALISLAVSLVGTVLLVAFVLRYMARTRRWQRIILADKLDKEHGFVAPRDMQALVGKEGYTLTPLRPTGTVEIEDERWDVISEGGFIPPGTSVKVVRVEGARVLVRPLKDD